MVMIVNRPSGWEPFAEGLGSAVNTFAKQKAEQNAYELLKETQDKAKAFSILGPDAYKMYKQYGNIAENASRTENEIKYGTGAVDQTIQQPISGTQQPQSTYLEQQPQQVKKQSELLDKLNMLAGHYQNRLIGNLGTEPQGQQPLIPGREQLLGGQFPRGFMEAPQQFGEHAQNANILRSLLGAQGREEGRLAAEPIPQTPMQQPSQQEPIKPKALKELPIEDQLRNLESAVLNKRLDPKSAKLIQNRLQKELEQKQAVDEKVLTDLKPTIDKAEAAHEIINTVNNLETLEQSGNLDTPSQKTFAGLIDKAFGEGSGTQFLSGDSQLFEKYGASFLKNLTKGVGSRPSVVALQAWMKQYPTLYNDAAGRIPIYKALKAAANLDLDYINEMKALKEENNGHYPRDARSQLLERMRYKSSINEERTLQTLNGIPQNVLQSLGDPNTLAPGKVRRSKITGLNYKKGLSGQFEVA
jgi:hypothetical protein